MYTGVICAHLLGLTVGNNLINLVVFEEPALMLIAR
jgi:hypothetical protein